MLPAQVMVFFALKFQIDTYFTFAFFQNGYVNHITFNKYAIFRYFSFFLISICADKSFALFFRCFVYFCSFYEYNFVVIFFGIFQTDLQ